MSELYWLGVLGNLPSLGVGIVALSVLAMIFLAFILGTIDYVKENNDANKIPDKCIKALDKYLDDALKEDKD